MKSLLKAAAIRAARTAIQTLIPALGAGAITDLNWIGGVSIAAGAGVLSFLQGILAGLPEADPDD
ncbi:phage r1t holin [Micrococcales bacterium KH10]|nr:phage r1t holin [Micrococcales bacterium KH10]